MGLAFLKFSNQERDKKAWVPRQPWPVGIFGKASSSDTTNFSCPCIVLAKEEIALTKPLHGCQATVHPNAVRAQPAALITFQSSLHSVQRFTGASKTSTLKTCTEKPMTRMTEIAYKYCTQRFLQRFWSTSPHFISHLIRHVFN
jgi:hypothetical protein